MSTRHVGKLTSIMLILFMHSRRKFPKQVNFVCPSVLFTVLFLATYMPGMVVRIMAKVIKSGNDTYCMYNTMLTYHIHNTKSVSDIVMKFIKAECIDGMLLI